MDKKGFISISVVYTIFMLFIMLILSVLATFANTRILLRVSKGDTEDILVENQDNRQVGIVCRLQQMGKCFSEYGNLDKNLIYHDGNDRESKSAYEAGDNAYRYAGNSISVHNYVCFGSNTSPCPANNLYRIIGIYNQQVKLIKNTPLSSTYKWNNTANNYFRESSLYEYLNTTFLNTFTTEWKERIGTATWNITGLNYNNGVNASSAKEVYDYEVGNIGGDSRVNLSYTNKIGLMSISDYYYAASPTYWNKNGNTYNAAKNYNWLAGYTEWTLSPYQDNKTNAFKIFDTGKVGGEMVTSTLKIRPSFYLYSPAHLTGGIGTYSDPYTIV